MRCAWKEFLDILPRRMVREIDTAGRERLLELRLRRGCPAEMILPGTVYRFGPNVTSEEIEYCVNTASRYSPWAATSIRKGYLTSEGGHRIGICGEVVVKDGVVTGIRNVSSLCIRLARDFPGISSKAGKITNSTLIIGAPGWGKTTLLRDLIRSVAKDRCVSVVDERGELFPEIFTDAERVDILTGCPKASGIDMVMRSMAPEYIAMDEITAEDDALALLKAHGSGVKLLATAHAGSLNEFNERLVYRGLIEHNVFKTVLVLRPDKTFTLERIRT